MSTITNIKGEVIDMMTGEVVGRAEGAPLEKAPRSAAGVDQDIDAWAVGLRHSF